jgi:hypothetical protein
VKLPVVKKILREDLKEAPSWVSGIIDPFNSFAETVYQALNKNITFRENVQAFVKELTYKTSAGYPTEDDVSFLNELKVKATGVLVLQAIEKTNYTPAPGPVYVPWVEDNGSIIVSSVTGLEASKIYMLRLLIS